jgi:oxygen-independent coproporphyrinogen-3 oxidase
MQSSHADASIPLGLYLHMPWCVRKCPYCDFNSHQVPEHLDHNVYIDALLKDLALEMPLARGRALQSVFIGGGTPSLFPPEQIRRLVDNITGNFICPPDMEVTLEANPGTLESGRYQGYREAGVNRLSIGVQSFDADALGRLGRIHGPGEAVEALQSAREAGFDNINLDLMFGLPGQSVTRAMADVERAISLRPEHISYYQLTLEPNTAFHKAPPKLPAEDSVWKIQQQGHALLAAAGYRRYEVSAFAQSGRQCRHNLNYWRFGDYMGVGAGAHGKLSDPRARRVARRWRLRGPGSYLQSAGSKEALAGESVLEEADLKLEFMMNALRLRDGFSPALFQGRTGLSFTSVESLIREGVERGLIENRGTGIAATPRGYRFLDDLVSLFM